MLTLDSKWRNFNTSANWSSLSILLWRLKKHSVISVVRVVVGVEPPVMTNERAADVRCSGRNRVGWLMITSDVRFSIKPFLLRNMYKFNIYNLFRFSCPIGSLVMAADFINFDKMASQENWWDASAYIFESTIRAWWMNERMNESGVVSGTEQTKQLYSETAN
jgi:hypothetical protein